MTKKVSEYSLDEISDPADWLPVSLDVSSELPSLSEMPDKAQHILALLAMGWSQRSIAASMDCKPETIAYYRKRYDPDGSFVLSKEARRDFITKLCEARVGEALCAITPEKLQVAPARDLAVIAERIGKLGQSLGGVGVRNRSSVDEFMRTLEG